MSEILREIAPQERIMSSHHCLIDKIVPEKNLFVWLNSHHNEFWDNFMWVITDKDTWIPVVIALLAMIFIMNPLKKSLWLLTSIVILVTLSDQISASFFKPYFQCFRPSNHPDFANIIHTLNNYRGGLYGFVSSHATNAFALAWFLSLVCRNKTLTVVIFFWAIINSYSRIYLGVHSLMDILGGMTLGTAVALVVYQMYIFVLQKINQEDKVLAKVTFIQKKSSQYFAIFFVSNIALVGMYAVFKTWF